MIQLCCPQCQTKVPVSEEKIGKTLFVCPKCSFPLDTPGASADMTAPLAAGDFGGLSAAALGTMTGPLPAALAPMPPAAPAPMMPPTMEITTAPSRVPPPPPLKPLGKSSRRKDKPYEAPSGSEPSTTGHGRGFLIGAGAAAGTAVLAGALIFALSPSRKQKDTDPSAEAAPMSILEVLALSEDLKSEDPETRAKAAVALGKAGKDARAAMPALLDALRDSDEKVRDLVADALDQAGPPAKDDFPALSTALRDDDPDVKTYAVSALEELGEPSWEEIDRVRELTKDPDPHVRAAAAKTLARMEKEMLESLRNRLKDSNPSTREEAAKALSNLGGASDEAAQKAAASLMAAMSDDNEAVRLAVSKALSDFGAQVVPMLSEALRNRNVVARRMAINSLSAMGDNAIDAAPVLAGMVDDADVGVAAADALNGLGDLAVPVIAAAVGSPTIVDARRVVLQNLLVRIGPGGLPAINYYVNQYPRARVYFNPVLNQLIVRANPYVRTPLTDPFALGYYRDYVNQFRALEHADRQLLNLEKAQQKLNMNAAAFKAFLKRVDRNGDGQVSRAEYDKQSARPCESPGQFIGSPARPYMTRRTSLRNRRRKRRSRRRRSCETLRSGRPRRTPSSGQL